MQFEMEQANAAVYTNNSQNFQNERPRAQAQPAVSSEMQGGFSQNQISQSRSYEYAQALAKAQEQEQANSAGRSSSFSTPRQSMSGDASFQSLMNNQNRGYGHNGMQQQQQQNTPTRVMSMQNLQQVGNQFYSTSPMMTPPTSQSFSIQSNVGEMVGQGVPRNMMEAQQQFQMHQQQMQHSGSVRSQSRVSTFQEFSAQIQHLDKSVLIELLWNQRSALARWQNQAKQLELQLSAKQNASSNMGSPGFPSPYNSPMVGGINPNVAAEAEMQRARERGSSRMTPQQQQQMQQYPYGQQSNESSPAYSQAGGSWGDNPQLYWDRIRVLKSAYEDQLRTAQRALAHNTAPPNSIYSVKAQSMMQNIGLVLTILNETPSNVQPRKFEVLNSIERFMQITVTPIVQKVLSSGAMAQSGSASQAMVSGPSSASAANVATYSSPARGNVVEMANSSRQTSDNQYSGTRWASSSSYSGMDTSRRGTFAAEDKSSIDDNGPRMDTPTQMMDGLATAGSNPSTTAEPGYAYEQVGVGNDGQAAGQSENSADQYGAPEIAPKETQTSALPVSESRPSTITEAQLSSGADLSPDGNARDTNTTKMVSVDDTLNDFSDFPVLDFDDPVPEGNSFVKENNPSNVGRKRGVEDV
ncbi:unnamed protein product [Phytophthora lilii]|uniref:Unnamed protein product n=1 Tax=Phytophthora lilii TaxID=2077276 RepID=A0A9W6TJ86_9STRA|nr:unnamed protein product [Phytophthora lilii]